MKKKVLVTIIMVLAYILIHGDTCNAVTNVCPDSSEKINEIEELIKQAPVMILSQTNNVGAYIDRVCEGIAKIPNTKMRYRYFRAFMESACTTHFEKIDDMVTLEKPESSTIVCFYDRQQEVGRLRAFAYRHLERVADQIFVFIDPVSAPGVELLDPWFKLTEKLKTEEKRLGMKPMSLCDRPIESMERIFLFHYLPHGRGKLDSQDRAVIETRFKQVVGRPIRTMEQYKTDARRRTMKNIQEQKEREEAKRKRQEQQKRQEGEK